MRRESQYDEPDCEPEHFCSCCDEKQKLINDCGMFYNRVLDYLYNNIGTLEQFEHDLDDVACYLDIDYSATKLRDKIE